MKFQLIDPTRFVQGLPQREELDDASLNETEKRLLAEAVAIGIYTPVQSSSKKVVKDVEQPETKN